MHSQVNISLAQARGKYIIDRTIMDIMQKHAVVLHPLPRVDEVRLGHGILIHLN